MTRIEINLQTAANHGYLFAIVDRAAYLGAGSNVEYIISKHKTYSAANRAIAAIMKARGPGNYRDLRIMPTVPSK
jgi:hypothetical protein